MRPPLGRESRSAHGRHGRSARSSVRKRRSVSAATIRGKIRRQLSSGGRLDGGEDVGRPAAVKAAHRRPRRTARTPTRPSASASTAAAIGSLSTSTPLQSKMTKGPSDGSATKRDCRPAFQETAAMTIASGRALCKDRFNAAGVQLCTEIGHNSRTLTATEAHGRRRRPRT